MSPDRQQLVQESWQILEPHAVRLVELGVLHLVEIVPAIRPVIEQRGMPLVCSAVAGLVAQFVRTLDDPKEFVPLAVSLGKSNPDRGITAKLYPPMGEALIRALQVQLGDAFTPELHRAWVECYHLVSALMRRAEQSRTGEFERLRTGEFVALHDSAAKEVSMVR